MRKFTKTMAAVLSLTMTLTMVTPVFAEGETNITPAQTTEVVTPTPTPAQPPKNGLFVNEGKTYCYKSWLRINMVIKSKRSITASTKKVLLL